MSEQQEPVGPTPGPDTSPGTLVVVPMAARTGPQPPSPIQPAAAPGVADPIPVAASVVAVSTVHWWEDRAFLSMAAAVVVDIAIEIDRLASTGTLSWHSAVPIVLGILASRFRKMDNTVVK